MAFASYLIYTEKTNVFKCVVSISLKNLSQEGEKKSIFDVNCDRQLYMSMEETFTHLHQMKILKLKLDSKICWTCIWFCFYRISTHPLCKCQSFPFPLSIRKKRFSFIKWICDMLIRSNEKNRFDSNSD